MRSPVNAISIFTGFFIYGNMPVNLGAPASCRQSAACRANRSLRDLAGRDARAP
ncbi:MAG TPA: hypothetical protein VGO50_17195 [Pyrinomonadaceae bacterium]|nr:hypothetical protein [Pyrinomonadaceae bacterium]